MRVTHELLTETLGQQTRDLHLNMAKLQALMVLIGYLRQLFTSFAMVQWIGNDRIYW